MKDKPVLMTERFERNRQILPLNLLVSMRAGMLLLGLIGAAALVGTIRPAIYHSWWFFTLEALLCLNVTACSIRRLPVLVKAASGRMRAKSGAERTAWLKPWATFAVHLSIPLIAAGGMIGNAYGFQEEILLPAGGVHTVLPAGGKQFDLRLNAFSTEYYPDGSVSDWISDITVSSAAQKADRVQVKVNHPLEFQGVSIYQQSYGTAIKTDIIDRGKVIQSSDLAERDRLLIDEASGLAVQVVRYIPDFDPGRPMISRSNQNDNPYVLYIVYAGGREMSWGAAPLGEAVKLGQTLSVRFVEAVPVSGLLIKHNPGLPVVWLGFGLMTTGFFGSLIRRRD